MQYFGSEYEFNMRIPGPVRFAETEPAFFDPIGSGAVTKQRLQLDVFDNVKFLKKILFQ